MDSAFASYRILDLTERGCLIGPRLLGDLGADVIKTEKPGGSPSRIEPYYRDILHPGKRLSGYAIFLRHSVVKISKLSRIFPASSYGQLILDLSFAKYMFSNKLDRPFINQLTK